MDIKRFKEEIEKRNRLKRKHAPFFQWHNRQIQEIGIAQDFFAKLEEQGEEYLTNIEPAENPPDVRIFTSKNRTLGVEITELVNQRAIQHQIARNPDYHEQVDSWDKENTLAAINFIIASKDKKCADAAKLYETIILLIFTDEPKLTFDTLNEYLRNFDWPQTTNIQEAYILMYDPKYRTQCLITLHE